MVRRAFEIGFIVDAVVTDSAKLNDKIQDAFSIKIMGTILMPDQPLIENISLSDEHPIAFLEDAPHLIKCTGNTMRMDGLIQR